MNKIDQKLMQNLKSWFSTKINLFGTKIVERDFLPCLYGDDVSYRMFEVQFDNSRYVAKANFDTNGNVININHAVPGSFSCNEEFYLKEKKEDT